MNLARVFPRRTTATPNDPWAFIGGPGLFPPEDVTHVNVSVAFSWDLPEAERIAEEWRRVTPNVDLAGPAFNTRGEEFTPGLYLKKGYVITSRGCPMTCWFCDVWKRDGQVRELAIQDGWIVQDDNLLACSEGHIRKVFAMLKRQPQRAALRGLEPSFLRDWHVNLMADLRPQQMFFAYDTPDDYEPMVKAGQMLQEAGFTRHHMRCYVLIGSPQDDFDKAEKRLRQTIAAGYFPFAMLWRRRDGRTDPAWRKFQKAWARPASIYAMTKTG